MKLYHTSCEKIEKIHNRGTFDDCLFFSTRPYCMGPAKYTYSLEVNEDKIINVSQLHDDQIIADICQTLEVNEDTAERMLDGRDTAFDHNGDGEDDWWIQARQGECAKKMGYEACRAIDEQGNVYIVPMADREHDLVLEDD